MTQEARDARNALERTQRELQSAQGKLTQIERACPHKFSNPEQKSKRLHEGYQTQSLMGHFTQNRDGSINAPMVYVPPKDEIWWERTCSICGKVEKTTQTETETTTKVKPKF